jgi:hypothetical protein
MIIKRISHKIIICGLHFYIEEYALIVIIFGELAAELKKYYHLLPVLKQNLDGHIFKKDRAIENVVTRNQITNDAVCYRQEL